MYILKRQIVVSALVLFVALCPRLAFAQGSMRSRAEVRLLSAGLRLRAEGLAIRNQVASQQLTQLQMAPQTFHTQMRIDRLASRVTATSAEYQTVLAARLLVGQLEDSLAVATRLNVRIELETTLLVRLRAKPATTSRYRARINNVQNALQADQAALLALEQQILILQQQVAQLFD